MFDEKVEQIMSADVKSICPDRYILEALTLMAQNQMSFVVVTSPDNKPLGVLTEKDVVRILHKSKYNQAVIDSVMSSPVLTVGRKDEVFAALHKLVVNNVHHLVVVDDHGCVAGVLTLSNFLDRLGFEYFVDFKDVSEIMEKQLVTTRRKKSVKEVISAISNKEASCALIMEKQKPVGIFTERDVVRVGSTNLDISNTLIEEVMSHDLETITEGSHVLDALTIMQRKRVRHLPVLDNKGRLTGLISQVNITNGMEVKYTIFLKKLIADQEKKLREANESLETKVKERTKKLKEEICERKRTEEVLKESREQFRNLALHLQEVREEESVRIARDIHDELGQVLSVLKLDLWWIDKRLGNDQKIIHNKIDEISTLIDNTIDSVQKITSELRPPLLDDLGIISVMEWQMEEFQKRTGIECKLIIEPDEIDLNNKFSTAIFRIFQEALTNITRHAMATRVYVSLKESEGNLLLKVDDNGKGVTDKDLSSPESFGLIGMTERLHPLCGTVDIKGSPGKGTTVEAMIPLSINSGDQE